jgi:hypothetical protein
MVYLEHILPYCRDNVLSIYSRMRSAPPNIPEQKGFPAQAAYIG